MKPDIALGILLTTLSKDNITAKELSSKYCISIRTIYRYVNALDLSGVPIVTKPGKNGGISILHTYNLNKMYFTTREVLTLIEACTLINDKTLQRELQTKLVQILHNNT